MHTAGVRSERGFTLVELLVVVVIIGILAAIAIPRFLDQRAAANDALAISDLRNLIVVVTGLEATDTGLTTHQGTLHDQGWQGSDDRILVCGLLTNDDKDVLLTAWHQDGNLQYSWQRSDPVLETNQASPMPDSCGGHDRIWPPDA